MKSIYTLIFLLAAFIAGNAQQIDFRSFEPAGPTHWADESFNATGSSGGVALDLSNPALGQSASDTLDQYFKRATGYSIYTFQTSSYPGYLFPLIGLNPYYLLVGERFVTAKPAKITEVLFAAAAKGMVGSQVDSFYCRVYSGDPSTGLPVNQIGQASIHYNDVDTNSKTPVFTSIKFTNPVAAGTNFHVMMLTWDGSVEYDGLMIYSNMQGDGANEHNTIIGYNNNGHLAASFISTFFNTMQMSDGYPPNLDALIFPIVDNDVSVAEPITMKGITLAGVSPDPASSFARFNFVIGTAKRLTIDLVGIDGRTAATETIPQCTPGMQNITFDLNNIPTGEYYYLITTNETKFGGKLCVVK